jgi:hypothetical protein
VSISGAARWGNTQRRSGQATSMCGA